MIAQGLRFGIQRAHITQGGAAKWCALGIAGLGRQRQSVPWSTLVSQLSLRGEF